MRVFELAKRRKTVRQFLPDKPSLDAIMKALEAAKEAP
ncbi:nitroreductase family protein, partial [Thermococcus sp. GR4]|nr:nitroreductase family protein [Thermococcus sp. GR4]